MNGMVFASRREKLFGEICTHAEVVSSTNYTRIHLVIRRDIILGEFAAGQRLKTADLSERYGLSSVPIREALQKLAGEGLVCFSPNKGVSVRAVDADFIRELHELRELVTTHLARRSVPAMTDDAIDDLVAIEDIFREVIERDDRKMVIRTNRFFHNTLDQFSRNEMMKRTIATHFEILETLRSSIGYTSDRGVEMQTDHEELIDACRARDGDRAANVMSRHVQRARDDYLVDFLACVTGRQTDADP